MCPVCREPLAVYELEGVEIDGCLSCGGLWFDAGELEWLVRRGGGDAARLAGTLERVEDERPGKRPCVRCGRSLRRARVAGVEIDRCAKGHGIWLDRGEARSLATSALGADAAPVAQFLGELLRSEIEPGPKGG